MSQIMRLARLVRHKTPPGPSLNTRGVSIVKTTNRMDGPLDIDNNGDDSDDN